MSSSRELSPHTDAGELLLRSSAASLLADWSPSRGGTTTQDQAPLFSSPPSVAPPAAPPSEVCPGKYNREEDVWICTADLKRPITILFRRRERHPCCAELSITDQEGHDLLASPYIQHCYGKEAHFAWNHQLGCAEATVNLTCSLRPNPGLSKKYSSYVARVRVTDSSGHSEELRIFVAAKSTAERKRSRSDAKSCQVRKGKHGATETNVCTACGK